MFKAGDYIRFKETTKEFSWYSSELYRIIFVSFDILTLDRPFIVVNFNDNGISKTSSIINKDYVELDIKSTRTEKIKQIFIF